MDELQMMFCQSLQVLCGCLCVDMLVGVVCCIVILVLFVLFDVYFELEIEFFSIDCCVDLVCEGFDCVLCIGILIDSSLIVCLFGQLYQVNCVSFSYIVCYGMLKMFDDFDYYCVVYYVQMLGMKLLGWEYMIDGCLVFWLMKGVVIVSLVESYDVVCCVGLGMIQVLVYVGLLLVIVDGMFIDVMFDFWLLLMLVLLVYLNWWNLLVWVQVFMNWMGELLGLYLELLGINVQVFCFVVGVVLWFVVVSNFMLIQLMNVF